MILLTLLIGLSIPPDSSKIDTVSEVRIIKEIDEMNAKLDKLTLKLDSISQINLEKRK